MKIVIDIDERDYERIKDLVTKDTGYTTATTVGTAYQAIANGIPYEERLQGEWTDLSTDGRHTGWIACSVCGQEPPNESNLRTNFCPNCGASMRNGDAE